MILIWHNNGNANTTSINAGYTEYTEQEVKEAGGLSALLSSCKKSGITIFEVTDSCNA